MTQIRENATLAESMAGVPYRARENRLVKNSILVDLFGEDKDAVQNDIALYNALHDKPLPEGTSIQKIQVENVLYLNFKNDISFGVNGKVLVLGEHQSTINRNMPLRNLLYVGRMYEQIVPVRDRYKKGIVQLPVPEFYTFYNGKDPMPAESEINLSEAYMLPTGDPMLELKVKIININTEAGHEILKKCDVLRQYSMFIETIRKYQKMGDAESYYHAILECMKNGILTDYLHRKGSEVVNMLQAEYDYEMDIAVQREEEQEETLRKVLTNILSAKGMISNAIANIIARERNPQLLNQWILSAVHAKSIDEIETLLK